MAANGDGADGPASLVHRFYDKVWNQADEALAREVLHADFRFRASLGPERRGPDGFIDYLRAVHRALGGYSCAIEDLIATETRAAVRLRFSGVHRADFFGVAATGREIGWAGAAFFTCAGGQITELWVLGDIDAVKRQLGAGVDMAFTSE